MAILEDKIRVRFAKTGGLQYISHLDLMRTMRTALKRARLPLKYTEGFNPHMKLNIALPLAVGAESVCEIMELVLTEPRSDAEIVEALSGSVAPGFIIYEAYTPVHKLAELGWAQYEIKSDEINDNTAGEIIKKLKTRPMMVLKRTKSGEKDTDIAPGINRISINSTYDLLTLVLCADGQNYLNPEYVLRFIGLENCSIMRTKVFIGDAVTEFR